MTTQLKEFFETCSEEDFITLNKAKSQKAAYFLRTNEDQGHYEYDEYYNGYDPHVMLLVLRNPNAEI